LLAQQLLLTQLIFSIADTEIIIANGATNSTTSNGAGLQLGTSNLSFKYEHANTRWNLPNAGLNIGGSLRINGTEVISSSGLGTGILSSALTSVGTLTSLTVSGLSKIGSVNEACETRGASQSGTQTYDFASRSVFYHPSVTGTITAAVTNVPTDSDRTQVVTILINNGATAYGISNSFGINGTSYTVKWNGGSAPTLKASAINAFSFTLLNSGGTWQVLGNMTAFN